MSRVRGKPPGHLSPTRLGLSCGYCRKRLYPGRREAKRALRHLYPGFVGNQMHAYRAACGGEGWHIGHRDLAQFASVEHEEQVA